ncbi:MAG: glycerophosphodiester phosphodiesterase family protein [Parachlamydiaceae bacterium]
MKNRVKPFIIAHRGNSGEAPENTVAAVDSALKLGVDFVEIDVRLSQDGIPVVIHDPSPKRSAGTLHSPLIHKLPFVEIRKIDVGSKFGKEFTGEKIPRLSELLHLKWNSTGLMIEIKEAPQSPADIINAVFAEINAIHTTLPQLIIGSFSLELFNEAKRRLHELKQEATVIGIVEKRQLVEPFVEAGAKRIALWHKLIKPDLAVYLNEQDIEMWTFTVDDMELAHTLVSMGVRGIISSVPRRILLK